MSKTKTPSISFKKAPRQTGLAGVAQMPSYDVKVDKKVCGKVSKNSPYNRDKGIYSIGLTVKKDKNIQSDENESNCDWQWIFFKNNCQTDEEAQAFIKQAILKLPAKYILHFLE